MLIIRRYCFFQKERNLLVFQENIGNWFGTTEPISKMCPRIGLICTVSGPNWNSVSFYAIFFARSAQLLKWNENSTLKNIRFFSFWKMHFSVFEFGKIYFGHNWKLFFCFYNSRFGKNSSFSSSIDAMNLDVCPNSPVNSFNSSQKLSLWIVENLQTYFL